MAKILIVLFFFAMTSCAISVEEARLSLRSDLSNSAEFLIARPLRKDGYEAARRDVEGWAGKIRECGGSTRIFTPNAGLRPTDGPRLVAKFNVPDLDERRLIFLCLAEKKDQGKIEAFRKEGWIWDYYTINVELNNGTPIHLFGDDFMPQQFRVQMPGVIVNRKDTSTLPFSTIIWTEEGKGAVSATIKFRTLDLIKAASKKNPPKFPDEVLRFSLESRVFKVDWMNVLTAVAALAALLPILGLGIRLIGRRRAKAAVATPRARKPRNVSRKAPRRRVGESADEREPR